MYVISLSSHWARKKSELASKETIDFISNNLDLRSNTDKSINWYIEKIGSSKFIGYPIFVVQYFTWANAKSTFRVTYSKNCSNCFAREHIVDRYNLLSM